MRRQRVRCRPRHRAPRDVSSCGRSAARPGRRAGRRRGSGARSSRTGASPAARTSPAGKEVEERLGPVSVVDEPIEGREEGNAVGGRPVFGLRMRLPPFRVSRTPSARNAAPLSASPPREAATVSGLGPPALRRDPRGADLPWRPHRHLAPRPSRSRACARRGAVPPPAVCSPPRVARRRSSSSRPRSGPRRSSSRST